MKESGGTFDAILFIYIECVKSCFPKHRRNQTGASVLVHSSKTHLAFPAQILSLGYSPGQTMLLVACSACVSVPLSTSTPGFSLSALSDASLHTDTHIYF